MLPAGADPQCVRVDNQFNESAPSVKAGLPSTEKSGWHGWPADALKPAIAPFHAEQAKKHQEEWAKHLSVPVEYPAPTKHIFDKTRINGKRDPCCGDWEASHSTWSHLTQATLLQVLSLMILVVCRTDRLAKSSANDVSTNEVDNLDMFNCHLVVCCSGRMGVVDSVRVFHEPE